MKLHEIELPTKDPVASKRFYHGLLGLPVRVDEEGLKVFDSGHAGLDFDMSVHNAGRTCVAFLVHDLEQTIATLRAKGVTVPEPFESHLGMRGIRLEDPDGNIVLIHAPTSRSPEWLRSQAT